MNANLITRRGFWIVGVISLAALLSDSLTGAFADGINGQPNGSVGLYVNGSTEAMHITTTGAVGIGTAAPSEVLDVQGNLRVGNAGYNYICLLYTSPSPRDS